jgi:3-hydroxybutyryl-CoA dehydratase
MNDYQWTDLAIGLRAEFKVRLTVEMLDSFATLSGDVNPLHLDQDFAHAAGFPGRVAFGLLTSAFYSQLVGVHLPGRKALLEGIDIDFKSPAAIGDLLSVSGQVSFLTEAYRRLELKARIDNESGKAVSKATIRVRLRE